MFYLLVMLILYSCNANKNNVTIDNVQLLLCILLAGINVIIIICLGWIYSSHISSKEGIQRYCYDINQERS